MCGLYSPLNSEQPSGMDGPRVGPESDGYMDQADDDVSQVPVWSTVHEGILRREIQISLESIQMVLPSGIPAGGGRVKK